MTNEMPSDAAQRAVEADAPESVIGWSLVQACWEKQLWVCAHIHGYGVYRTTTSDEDLSGEYRNEEVCIASAPDPIRAMLAALNGGG